MTTPAPATDQAQPTIEKSFNLFNPGGDPGVLRACAQAWRDMSRDLRGVIENQDAQVSAAADAWTGTAAESFHEHWAKTKQGVEDALPHFEEVAQQLETAADAIAAVNSEVHRVMEEIAGTVAIGIGLSVLTAGFSDLLAAGAAEAEIAEAAGEVTRLGQLLIKISEVLEKVKEAMEGSKLLKFGVEFGKNFAGNTFGNVAGQAVAGQPITWGADIQDGAVSAGVGTGLGLAGGALGGKLASDSKIGAALSGKGMIGGAVNGLAIGGAGQASADGVDMAEGSKDSTALGEDTLTSGLSGGLGGGLTGGLGRVLTGSGRHRAGEDPTFPEGAKLGLNTGIGTAGNAIENDLTADNQPDPGAAVPTSAGGQG